MNKKKPKKRSDVENKNVRTKKKGAGMFTDVTGCRGNQSGNKLFGLVNQITYFLLCDGFSEHGSHERQKKNEIRSAVQSINQS